MMYLSYNWYLCIIFFTPLVQGPLAAPVLQHLTKEDLSKLYFGEFQILDINGAKCFLTRTGYVAIWFLSRAITRFLWWWDCILYLYVKTVLHSSMWCLQNDAILFLHLPKVIDWENYKCVLIKWIHLVRLGTCLKTLIKLTLIRSLLCDIYNLFIIDNWSFWKGYRTKSLHIW